jgi:hypothetical protein
LVATNPCGIYHINAQAYVPHYQLNHLYIYCNPHLKSERHATLIKDGIDAYNWDEIKTTVELIFRSYSHALKQKILNDMFDRMDGLLGLLNNNDSVK